MKYWLNILVALFLVLSSSAQPRQAASGLSFRETEWNFGEIREADGSVSHTFEFTNGGKQPVVIEQVTTSCGCTTPKYSKEPILPGRRGSIEVAFDPANRPGPFSKSIQVVSSGNRRDALTIRGTVAGRPRTVEEDYPVAVTDALRIGGRNVSFSYVGQGTTKSMTVKYMNNSSRPLTLETKTDPASAWFSISAPATVCAGCRGEITLTYDLSNHEVWGPLSNAVTLIVDGKPQPTTLQASGYGVDNFAKLSEKEKTAVPRARFSKLFFNFGDIKKNAPVSRMLTLLNEGSGELAIRHVKTKPGVSCTLRAGDTAAPGQELPVTVTLDPGRHEPGRMFANITVIVNDPVHPVREIRLSANVLP